LMINGNRTWHKKAKYSVAAFSFKVVLRYLPSI
jgi:hypothetical protein